MLTPSFIARVRTAAGIILGKSGASAYAAWSRGEDLDAGNPSETMASPYAQSAWVQAAIRHLAGPVAAVPVEFYRSAPNQRARSFTRVSGFRSQSSETHIINPILEAFLAGPMPGGFSWVDLVEGTVGWLKMSGEAFWLIPDDAMPVFPEAWSGKLQILLARPDRMRHLVDRDGTVIGWEYRDARGASHSLLPESVIHVRFWNPDDPHRGLAPWLAAKTAAESAWLSGKFKRSLAANNGDTGPYLVAKSGIPSPEQREQIIADLRAKRADQARGKFRPAFLTGDITVEDPKIRSVDAAFIASILEDRHEVFAAFGVPPSLADVKAAYSIGSASDYFQLITTGCMPLGAKITAAVDALILRTIKQTVCTCLDWDEHPVMQEVRRERMASIDTLWTKGMPMAEISEYLGLGLPRFTGDTTSYLPFSVAPAGSVTEPTTDPALSETEGEETAEQIANEKCSMLNAQCSPSARASSSDLWSSHMRRRASTRKAYAAKFNRLLVGLRVDTLKNLAKHWPSSPSTLSALSAVKRSLIDLIFDSQRAVKFGEALRVAVETVAKDALAKAVSGLFDEIGYRDPWKLPSQDVLTFLSQREKPLLGTGQTIRDQVNTVLETGAETGATLDEITDQVRACFNNISRYEAERIASTETQMAYGFARDKAMRQAGVQLKSWLSSHGPNVRPSHAAAEARYGNAPIPLDEPFIVGGEALMFPGDPNGSPGNVINCQCIQLAVKPEQ